MMTNDDDNDSLLLIDKNEKHIFDMSTISSWKNLRQCYLRLDDFRSDTMLDNHGDNNENDDHITIDDDKDDEDYDDDNDDDNDDNDTDDNSTDFEWFA